MPHSLEPLTAHGRRPSPTRDPLVGTMLDDRFLIEARIATGGFGAVYRARTSGGEPVAVKILHPQLTGDPNMVARFRREGATLTQLHDPNTVTTLAVGEARDGTLYIAMELLTGESLHDRLRRDGALPWQTAVSIARAVCRSLAEAHALGVVHRDLKPENIHVAARGDAPEGVKVIDFGIVKIERGSSIDDGQELTYAGHMIGTYEYMSPEQIAGSPCRNLSDIYSLGVVIYEMLTGHRPFSEVTGPASLLTALLTQAPVPPSQLAQIPPALDRIVLRCLEREPEDRYGDIRALAAALDRVLACPPHEAVTAVHRAYAPPRDERCGSAARGGPPTTAVAEEERTWIDAPREGQAIPAIRIAAGTGPVRRAPLAALYTTLPGIAVATRPPTVHGHRPTPRAPALAPPGWPPAAQAWAWPPAPAIPCALGSGPYAPPASGPCALPLPARSYGVRWLALVALCLASLVLATAI